MVSLPSPAIPQVDPARLSIQPAYQPQLHAESHDRSNPFPQQQTQQVPPPRHHETRPSLSPPTSISDGAALDQTGPMPPPRSVPAAMGHFTTAPSFSSTSTFSQAGFSPPAGTVFPASPDSALRSSSPRHSPSHHRMAQHDQYWQTQTQQQHYQQQQQQQQQLQQQHGQQTFAPSPLYRYEVAEPGNDHYTPQQYYYPAQFYPHSTSPTPVTPPAPQMTAQERRRAKEILKARRHVCPMCDKRFNRPSSLATHMSVHTGAKPYQCNREGCGRRFSVSSNLRRHERTHDMRGARNVKSEIASPRTPARQPVSVIQAQPHTPQPHPASPATTTLLTPQYQYVYQPAYQQQVEYGMWHGAGGLRQYAITRRDPAATQVVQPTTPPTPPTPILMPQPTKSNSLMLS